MFARLSGLFGIEIYAGSEGVGLLDDFLISGALDTLLYLRVAPAAGHLGTAVYIPIGGAADPDPALNRLSLGLSRAELGQLTGIDLLARPSRENERLLHDLIHWRPYWQPRDEARKPDMHSLKRALGIRVTCSNGAVGTLADVFADTADWSTPIMELNFVQQLDMVPALLPTGLIETTDWTERVIRLNAPLKDIVGAPRLVCSELLELSGVDAIVKHFNPSGRPHGNEPGRNA